MFVVSDLNEFAQWIFKDFLDSDEFHLCSNDGSAGIRTMECVRYGGKSVVRIAKDEETVARLSNHCLSGKHC